jgi:hypothetical protein
MRPAGTTVTAAVTAAQQPLLASLKSLLDILEQQAASVRSPASGGGAASAALQDLARFYTDELGKASAQLGEMTARAQAAEVEVARLRALSGHEWSYALDDAEPPAARGDFSRGLRDAPLAALNVISTRLSLALKEVHEARNERVVEEHGSVHIYFLGKTPVVPVLCVDDPKQQAAAHKESEINYKTSYEQVHKRTLLQIESLHSELDVLQAESDWTPEMSAKNTEIEQLRAALVCALHASCLPSALWLITHPKTASQPCRRPRQLELCGRAPLPRPPPPSDADCAGVLFRHVSCLLAPTY